MSSFTCGECGQRLESADTKHTLYDCGKHHFKRYLEIFASKRLTDEQREYLKEYGVYAPRFLADILSELYEQEELFGDVTISDAIEAVTNEIAFLKEQSQNE